MARSASTPEYDAGFIRRLELMWGEGFLSPGGAGEVRAILAGEDLRGAVVLEVGSGAGGAALLMARECGIARIHGIDVVPELVERSRRLFEAAGLQDRASFALTAPGPLAFDDDAFDVVFTKDAFLHMPDKAGIFREVFRVLKPGGRFLGSDWLAGPNIAQCPAWASFLELRRPSFVMVDAAEMTRAMVQAGFIGVASTDRSDWFKATASRDVERVEGPLRQDLMECFGQPQYEEWLAVRRAIAGAAASGALRPTHLKGWKPDKGRTRRSQN
jgi:phosphoethanolamine N-methyltransferase